MGIGSRHGSDLITFNLIAQPAFALRASAGRVGATGLSI
jgi:hypothetical protein